MAIFSKESIAVTQMVRGNSPHATLVTTTILIIRKILTVLADPLNIQYQLLFHLLHGLHQYIVPQFLVTLRSLRTCGTPIAQPRE